MKKQFALLLTTVLILTLTAVVYAGIVFIPVGGLKYDDLGQTTHENQADGRVVLTTTGLCVSENSPCDSSTPVTIQQDLKIVIEFTGAGVVQGRTQGEVFIPPQPLGIDVWEHAYFRSPVQGRAECTAVSPQPCSELKVSLSFNAPLRVADSDNPAGHLKIDMEGIVKRDGAEVAWSELSIVSGDIRARTE